MLAYHFVGRTLRDGSDIPSDGEWLIHEGEVEICKSGLHASIEPFDTLKYAPGTTICLVEVEDIVEEHKDKLVCRRRKIVKRKNIETLLLRFAADCVLSVSHLWPMPDIVREYLTTLDETKREEARITIDADYDDFVEAAYDAAVAAYLLIQQNHWSLSTTYHAAAAAAICYAYHAVAANDSVSVTKNQFNEAIYNLFK